MNKKIIIAVVIIIFLITAGAGCLESDKKPSSPNIKYEEAVGNYPMDSGWLDSDMENSPTHIDTSLALDINVSEKVTVITILMSFEDSDSAHSESDSGSDPDDVSISITDGKNTSAPASGTTPCALEVQLNTTEEGDFMSGIWEIIITATCEGNKKYAAVRPWPVVVSPLVYLDQGVAYTLTVKYSYLRQA